MTQEQANWEWIDARVKSLEQQNAWQKEIIDELRMKLLDEIIKNTYANRTIENLQVKDDE